MFMWELLGIDPTDDLREIKSAYARQVKTIRPDEKPEDFQNLYAAYKRATAQARARQVRETEAVTGDIVAMTEADETGQPHSASNGLGSAPHAQVSEEQQALQQRMQADGEELLVRCDLLLVEKKGNLTGAWEFLLESPFILDPTFNDVLGTHLFLKIYEHNRNHAGRRSISNQIEPRAMTYLNDIFGWSSRAPYLQYAVGEDACAALLPLIYERERIPGDREAIRGVRGAAVVDQRSKQSLDPELQRQSTISEIGRELQAFLPIACVVIFLLVYAFVRL